MDKDLVINLIFNTEYINNLVYGINYEEYEFSYPSRESKCYVLICPKDNFSDDYQALLAMAERLEYILQGWQVCGINNNSDRALIFRNFILESMEYATFVEVTFNSFIKRIKEYLEINDIERFGEKIKGSKIICLHDMWNEFHVFGTNYDSYFMFLWWTTA